MKKWLNFSAIGSSREYIYRRNDHILWRVHEPYVEKRADSGRIWSGDDPYEPSYKFYGLKFAIRIVAIVKSRKEHNWGDKKGRKWNPDPWKQYLLYNKFTSQCITIIVLW